MGQQVKKISTLVLLVVLLAPFWYPLVYKIQLQAIRYRMKEKLAKEMLVYVELPANEIIWLKPGMEIMVQGKMFDVHSLQYKKDGTVRIAGLYDEDETALEKKMKERQQPHDTQSHQQLTLLFQQIQAVVDGYTVVDFKNAIRSGYHYPPNDTKILSPFTGVLTPPPRA